MAIHPPPWRVPTILTLQPVFFNTTTHSVPLMPRLLSATKKWVLFRRPRPDHAQAGGVLPISCGCREAVWYGSVLWGVAAAGAGLRCAFELSTHILSSLSDFPC